MLDSILKVRDALVEYGFDGVMSRESVEDDWNSIFDSVIIMHNSEFSVEFSKSLQKFIFTTSFSNQEINKDWLDDAKFIWELINSGN